MLHGVIRVLTPEKGYGFIEAQDGTADVFFHRSALPGPIEGLRVGQSVTYELDSASDKVRAKRVQPGPVPPGAAPVARSTSGGARSTSGGDRRGGARPMRDNAPRGQGGRGTSGSRGPSGSRGASSGRGAAGRPGDRMERRSRDGQGARAAARHVSSSEPDQYPKKDREFGFITKLEGDAVDGYISSIEHGPEIWFPASVVVGEKPFAMLRVGDYVAFIRDKNAPDPDEPIATLVIAVEREQPTENLGLPRHKRSQRKKPSWRG